MQLFAFIFNAIKSKTLHIYQADFVELQNSKYFKEMKQICSVQPVKRLLLCRHPAQGCPATGPRRDGVGTETLVFPNTQRANWVQAGTVGRRDYTGGIL